MTSIPLPSLEHALGVFATAYEGRPPWKGQPASLHPLSLMVRLDAPDERIAALFHDLCHDCPDWSPARLAAAGFPDAITDAVAALTRADGEDRSSYIERLAHNDLARRVKLAELVMGREALPDPAQTEEHRERQALYEREVAQLEALPSRAR